MRKYILSAIVAISFGFYISSNRNYVAHPVPIIAKSPAITPNIPDSGSLAAGSPPANNPTPVAAASSTTTQPAASKPATTPTKVVQQPAPKPAGQFRNGRYAGISADAYYGYVQVQAVISNGKLTDIQMLDYPSDRGTSVRINSYALPQLISEAIQAQSARVAAVSGATDTSQAFIQSLSSALAQAKS